MNEFAPGANYASKDGKRNVVIDKELHTLRGRGFAIRNLETGRVSHVEISGLTRKFRFTGYDPAYEPAVGAAREALRKPEPMNQPVGLNAPTSAHASTSADSEDAP